MQSLENLSIKDSQVLHQCFGMHLPHVVFLKCKGATWWLAAIPSHARGLATQPRWHGRNDVRWDDMEEGAAAEGATFLRFGGVILHSTVYSQILDVQKSTQYRF